MNTETDVIIIGGGPAGSSMGAYLAKAGVKCIVFEKEKFPRPHVGESLVPASTRVFRELDFISKMEEAGFPKKFGAAWTTHNENEYHHDFKELIGTDADIRFDEREQADVYQNYTYHVDRGLFDQLLLEHAQELGATVYQEVDVFNVDFISREKVEVKVRVKDSEEKKFSAKIVVDASGRHTFIGNKLKLKIKDPVFNQCAIHTWFSNYDRQIFKDPGYIYIHFIPVSNTWLWQIPINETITSFGIVTQKQNFPASAEKREAFFWECIATHPKIEKELKKAKRERPFTVEADYSYAMTELVKDNLVLIGDAARFVDPIFSSGVSVALNSARFASKDVITAIKNKDYSAVSFENYNKTIRAGVNNWYNFIKMYYRLNVLFTYFVNKPQYRMDTIKFLQGDVYDDARPKLLDEMEKIISEVENNPKHVLHAFLGTLTANAFNAVNQKRKV
jgi:1H-pyrrole-2-carbonyl-[peptidyl-carrier protein] chlorinase